MAIVDEKAPISLEEKVARTIDLFARKDLFLEPKSSDGVPETLDTVPTTHFYPEGVTTQMKATELWDMALEKCGLNKTVTFFHDQVGQS